MILKKHNMGFRIVWSNRLTKRRLCGFVLLSLTSLCLPGLVNVTAARAEESPGESTLAAKEAQSFPEGRWWAALRLEPAETGVLTDDRMQERLVRWQEQDPSQTLELLERAALERGVLMWDAGRFLDPWIAMERYLRKERPELVAQLRGVHAPAGEADAMRPSDSLHATMAQFRASPWASAVHEVMLAEGERLLRAQSPDLAWRVFEDVVVRTEDAAHADRARRGQRLSKRPRDDSIAASPAGPVQAVAVPGTTPWPLRTVMAAPSAMVAQMPPMTYELVPFEGGLLAAAPGVLAGYGEELTQPRWMRHSPVAQSDLAEGRVPAWRGGGRVERQSERLVLPGRFQPAVGGQTVFTRWALDATSGQTGHLAAFDLRSGQLRWCTSEQSEWGERVAVGDPAWNEGRVYVLTAVPGMRSRIELVALDAQDGRVLWMTPLLHATVEVWTTYWGQRYFMDLMAYGSGVAVERGAVYVQTNAGVAARLDARDGMVEWLRSYERPTDDVAWAGYPRRRGGRPHVVGDTLVLAPRDDAVVLALDASSGRLLWQRGEAGGEWIVGVDEGRLVMAGRSGLSALAMTSGQTQWVHELAEPLRDASWIDGRSIAVSTLSRVEAVDPGTGESVGALPTTLAGAAEALAPMTGGLVAVTHEPDGVKQIEGMDLPADAVAGRRWGLVRSSPELVAASESGRLLVRSGTLLECLEPSAKEPVRWQRFITADLRDAVVTGETVLLAFHDRVLALDLDTGRHRWEVDVPFEQVQDSSTPRPQWHLKLMPHQDHVLVVFESVPWNDYPAMMVQIDEGKVLWSLDAMGDAWGRFMAYGVVWEGEQLFLLANANERGSMVVPVDIQDGTLGEPERFHPDDQPFIDTSLVIDGRRWFALGEDGTLRGHAIQAGAVHRLFQLPLPNVEDRTYPLDPTVRLTGSLAVIQRHRRGSLPQPQSWIVDLEHGELIEHLLDATVHTDGSSAWFVEVERNQWPEALVVQGRADDERRAYAFPEDARPAPHYLHSGRVVGDTVIAVTAATSRSPYHESRAPRHLPNTLRVDAWNQTSGKHIQGEGLPVAGEDLEVLWDGQTLVVIDDSTIQAIDIPIWLHPVRSGSWHAVKPFDETLPSGTVTAAGLQRHDAHVLASHDGETLRIAIELELPAVRPRRGSRWSAFGTWLELGLLCDGQAHRMAIGYSPQGQAHVQSLDDMAGAVEAQVDFDLARGRVQYTVALDAESLGLGVEDVFGLALSHWTDAELGAAVTAAPRRTLLLGEALAGTVARDAAFVTLQLKPPVDQTPNDP